MKVHQYFKHNRMHFHRIAMLVLDMESAGWLRRDVEPVNIEKRALKAYEYKNPETQLTIYVELWRIEDPWSYKGVAWKVPDPKNPTEGFTRAYRQHRASHFAYHKPQSET